MSDPREHDEYLWSKDGPPDAEVERLERLLGRFRHVPEIAPPAVRRPFARWAWWFAAAALAVAGATFWVLKRESGAGYRVEGLAGVSRLLAGDDLVAATDARLEIAGLGDVDVRRGTRLRLEQAGEDGHRLFLEEGKLSASIFARPRLFQIGTPAGLSVDLGCRYDLEVDAEGLTRLFVTSGRVAFETEGRKVIVPKGAECIAIPGRGPDTPVFEDAEPDFRRAVREIEFEAEPDPAAVAKVIELARREDSLSLYFLLDAPSRALREAVYKRLAGIYPLPADATREGLIVGDETMRREWRREMEHDWL